MALHFERTEFAARVSAARAAMKREDLAAILLFSQESLFYLTGFDTSGFVFFQCAVLTADEGPVTLLTRRPDLEQARRTSTIEDIRIWYDAEGAGARGGEHRLERVIGQLRRAPHIGEFGRRFHEAQRPDQRRGVGQRDAAREALAHQFVFVGGEAEAAHLDADPRGSGGLEVLCRAHHREITSAQARERAARRRALRESGESGESGESH